MLNYLYFYQADPINLRLLLLLLTSNNEIIIKDLLSKICWGRF